MKKPKIFHGDLHPDEIAREIVGEFNRGNLKAQKLGSGKNVIVQIATRDQSRSGGHTALSVSIKEVSDGVSIQLGEQSWLGIAASLGQSALWVWKNPWNLISRLDDLAQDFENLQLYDQVWEKIENIAYNAGATFELSERLKRLKCEYCHTANPVGAPSCIACGAPLGSTQPRTCKNCGFVVEPVEKICPNCGGKLS